MRVFVTGATGWVGSAVVPELIGAGHEVVGLARSDASAAALATAGAAVHRGSLDDFDGLHAAADAADGVVHLAFPSDFGDFFGGFEAAAEQDRRVVRTFGDALEGTGKPLVVTSGTLLVAGMAPGRLGTEGIAPEPDATAPRVASEAAAIALAERGVRTSVMRLAPTVHGEGDRGFVPHIIDSARKNGVSAYVGDGTNRWPGVHRFDAARLYRLALESAPAGSILHGVSEAGVPVRDIAEVIGRHLGLPVASIGAEEAGGHFGFLGGFIALDNPVSNELTRKLVGWRPERPGLIADLEEGHYFRG